MDFELDEGLLLIRDTARALARERIAPRAREIDVAEQYPEDVFQLFREQGLLGLAIPEAEGGAGPGVLGLSLAIEETAWACASSAQILALNLSYSWPLLVAGSRAQKETYLAPAAAGHLRGAFALTEPNAGSDMGSMVARAERQGDGYLLNGEKIFVSGGPQADFFILFAKVGAQEGSAGLTAFILPTASPHLFQLRQDRGMGVRGVPHPDYALENYPLPASLRLGEEGQGYEIARRSLNAAQPVTAARALGLAERCLSYALDYSLTRRIYGAFLADLGTVRARLAEMSLEIEAARLLTYQAAWLVDQGRNGPDAEAYLSAAKTFSSEMAVRVAGQAMEVLGGHGYMTEHPIERWYRDARQLVHYALTNDIHRQTIAQALVDRRLTY